MMVRAHLAVALACCAVLSMRSAGRTRRQSKFGMFRELLRVAIPRWVSSETFLVVALGLLSVLRALLVVQSSLSRKELALIVVGGRRKRFACHLLETILWYAPRAVIDSSLNCGATILGQKLRSNLQSTAHKALLERNAHLHQKFVEGSDHRMTHDAMMWCFSSIDAFMEFVGPVSDIVVLLERITQVGDGSSLAGIATFSLLSLSSAKLLPDCADMLSSVQSREADMRMIHSQIATHAEEVAFYRGESIERDACNRRFDAIVRKISELTRVKAVLNFAESMITKYCATATGYLVCARRRQHPDEPVAATAGRLIYSQQLYAPLSQAVGKMARVHQRFATVLSASQRTSASFLTFGSLTIPSGQSWRGPPRIVLEGVEVPPTSGGEPLLKNVSLCVVPGHSVLITGTCGVGKSSLVGVIAGTIKACSGSVRIPTDMVLIVPQRGILGTRSLREVLCYPLDQEAMQAKGVTDFEVCAAAAAFRLTDLLSRCKDGLDTVKPWDDVLSGGEVQKIGLTRVAIQRPTFAILDDCTNALTQHDEFEFLSRLQSEGTTLLTVSHRSTLKPLHETILFLDDFA